MAEWAEGVSVSFSPGFSLGSEADTIAGTVLTVFVKRQGQ